MLSNVYESPASYSVRVAKKAFVGFRLNSELKAQIEVIAKKEERSMSQVCELLLRGAIEEYKKQGAKFFQRLLLRFSGDKPS
jgi:hypothetical protein